MVSMPCLPCPCLHWKVISVSPIGLRVEIIIMDWSCPNHGIAYILIPKHGEELCVNITLIREEFQHQVFQQNIARQTVNIGQSSTEVICTSYTMN